MRQKGMRIVRDDQDQWGEELRREVERIDAGGDAWEGSKPVPEARQPHFHQPLDKVLPVRLTTEQWERLHAKARCRGVGPSTLLRMWALEKLDARSA